MSTTRSIAAILAVTLLATARLTGAQTGVLTQLPGLAACVSQDGTDGACTDGRGLVGGYGVAASPDGENVYVASRNGDTLAIFARDKATGVLAQLPDWEGCISDDGSDAGAVGDCEDGKALRGAWSVAVSPDGKSVYVASESGGVAAFARDRSTGALTQLRGRLACVAVDGLGGVCTTGRLLQAPRTVTVSPDGRNVYVGAAFGMAIFARDTDTGALTQLPGEDGCLVAFAELDDTCRIALGAHDVFGVAVSPDGKHVYAASDDVRALMALARDKATGALTPFPGIAGCFTNDGNHGAGPEVCVACCTDARGIGPRPQTVAVSDDGRSVYVGSMDFNSTGAVAAFARNKRTGQLTQLAGLDGCISTFGDGGECGVGLALAATSIALSPDGKSAYVASLGNGMAILARNTSTGVLTQLPVPLGCITDDTSGGLCTDGTLVHIPFGITVTNDGASVYMTQSENFREPPYSGISAFARAKR